MITLLEFFFTRKCTVETKLRINETPYLETSVDPDFGLEPAKVQLYNVGSQRLKRLVSFSNLMISRDKLLLPIRIAGKSSLSLQFGLAPACKTSSTFSSEHFFLASSLSRIRSSAGSSLTFLIGFLVGCDSSEKIVDPNATDFLVFGTTFFLPTL